MAVARKRHTPEQIINKRRQTEVDIANGATVAQVCEKIGVTEQTWRRWRGKTRWHARRSGETT